MDSDKIDLSKLTTAVGRLPFNDEVTLAKLFELSRELDAFIIDTESFMKLCTEGATSHLC